MLVMPSISSNVNSRCDIMYGNDWIKTSVLYVSIATVLIGLISWGLMATHWSFQNDAAKVEAATAAGLVQKVVIINPDASLPSTETIWVKPETPVSDLASRGQPKKAE